MSYLKVSTIMQRYLDSLHERVEPRCLCSESAEACIKARERRDAKEAKEAKA